MKQLPPIPGHLWGNFGWTTFFRPCPKFHFYEMVLSASVSISENPSIQWTTLLLSHGPPHGGISGQYSALVPTYPEGRTTVGKVQLSNLPLICGKG